MREIGLCYVYILASGRNGTLYVGVTNDIARRGFEHRTGAGAAFTRRHGVARLVWIEPHQRIVEAIAREKQIKGWNRAWKLALIEKDNPQWLDLYDVLNGSA
jgi:putative endonuclease